MRRAIFFFTVSCLLAVSIFPSEAHSQVVIEAGLGPISFQDQGLQSSWLNPSFGIGFDLIHTAHFRLMVLNEFALAQSRLNEGLRGFAYNAPALRFYYAQQDSIHESVEVGFTPLVFTRLPTSTSWSRPDASIGFVELEAEKAFGDHFGFKAAVTAVFYMDNASIGSADPFYYIQGQLGLQFFLGHGSKSK